MLFNVTKAVKFIVDDTKDRYFRAIKLFELHVAIRLANGCDTYEEDTNKEGSLPSPILVYVSTPKMREAQMFATIRLMEDLERQLKKKEGYISAKLLISNPDWERLFDKRFVRFGGFRCARYLPRPADFDNEVRVRRCEAKKSRAPYRFFVARRARSKEAKTDGRYDDGQSNCREVNVFQCQA